MTSVLTTGATGLVGSRIIELLQDDYSFQNLDLATGVDITDPESLAKAVKNSDAKTMIHFAAFTNVAEAYAQTGDKNGVCYKVNVEGTKNIVNLCREHGIYLIHFSTDFVFAGDQEEPYTESSLRNPIEWYGQTKAWAEEEVEKLDKDYAVVRIGYPFRAKFPTKPDIVAKILGGLSAGNLYPQFSDMIITPTFIDDLAPAIKKLVASKPTGIYHLSGSSSLSPLELARKVAVQFGFDPGLVKEGSLAEYLKTTDRPYQKTLRIDNSKAKSELDTNLSDIDSALASIFSQLQ